MHFIGESACTVVVFDCIYNVILSELCSFLVELKSAWYSREVVQCLHLILSSKSILFSCIAHFLSAVQLYVLLLRFTTDKCGSYIRFHVIKAYAKF